MIARTIQCHPHLLQLAVADHLSSSEHDQLALHLESCESCRKTLDEISGGPTWHSRVAQSLSSSNVLASVNRKAPDGDEDFDSPDDDWLALLEPSNVPDKLGRIGKYEIESRIGRGGFGIVFKAFDPELNRYVAIKVLSTPLAHSAAARKRFRREACAAAAVVHDHVVPIHHVEHAGKVPYLVMPLISGRSLQQRLDDEGTLSIEEVLRIARQTALGLAAAHQQGLIHRDIKPANILLENGVERVRISDFGLARTVDDASATQSGFIAGTPSYMAPEQARGESLDHRADLFSLGSVMYAMCAGHPPFRADTTLAVLRRIVDDEPRDVREYNPSVPQWLWQIIARLLSKAPGERFTSADEVAELLERWLAHLQNPTVVPAPSPGGRGSCRATPAGMPSRRAEERGSRGATWWGVMAGIFLTAVSAPWWYDAISRYRAPSGISDAQPSSQQVDRAQHFAPSLPIGLKPDQLQAELDVLAQQVTSAESGLPELHEPRATLREELQAIQSQIQVLDYEISNEPPLHPLGELYEIP